MTASSSLGKPSLVPPSCTVICRARYRRRPLSAATGRATEVVARSPGGRRHGSDARHQLVFFEDLHGDRITGRLLRTPRPRRWATRRAGGRPSRTSVRLPALLVGRDRSSSATTLSGGASTVAWIATPSVKRRSDRTRTSRAPASATVRSAGASSLTSPVAPRSLQRPDGGSTVPGRRTARPSTRRLERSAARAAATSAGLRPSVAAAVMLRDASSSTHRPESPPRPIGRLPGIEQQQLTPGPGSPTRIDRKPTGGRHSQLDAEVDPEGVGESAPPPEPETGARG